MAKNTEEIRPIILTDTETGDKYTLEFTRSIVQMAQKNGFKIDEVDEKPMVIAPELFYYAFKAHHRYINREKTDKILYDDLKGFPNGMLERLVQLYYLPYNTLLRTDEEESKNSKMTVEF